MRRVRTCILRLLVDPLSQSNLQGSVLPLPDGPSQSFKDQESLVVLLKELILETQQEPLRIESTPAHPCQMDDMLAQQ